ncbi:STAS domain-containing protein [Granulicella sp. L60]|uniref:STAS domain-containing protein n=1 Tax=Granulicella sp. L60 TaxID=1641866 RepID=UPI00131C7AC7|nr:STAS domain-containing protein [Granulicella sp. L60]
MSVGTHTFHCEVEKSEDGAGGKVTRVICHGHVVNQTGDQLKDTVKPLIKDGGHILVDLTDVSYVDSMGLGTLVGLKVSAVSAGFCTLEFVNLSKRLQELLKLTHLTSMLSS